MKKLLSAIIVVTMLIGAMGTTAFAAYGFDATTDNKIKVDFVNRSESEGQVIYDIELSAAAAINRLNTADLTFKLNVDEVNGLKGDINYEILGVDEKIEINKVVENRYEFHYVGKEGVTTDTATSIKIGKVKFTGYGKFDFYVDTDGTADDTNLVTATTINNNLVTEFGANGLTEGTLDLTDVDGTLDDANPTVENITDEVIKIATRDLTIEIAFPNVVSFNAAAYQNMEVNVSGGLAEVPEIKLGKDTDTNIGTVTYGAETSEYTVTPGTTTVSLENAEDVPEDVTVNAYTIKLELPLNTNYTIEVTGDGYRTARYNVVLSDDKTVKFWNNVMDELRVMELDNDESKATVNFLAGDIVEDSNINIYDLSAVVSYFNTDLDETGAKAEDFAFVKYDLNRDGIIDSKDVAYVLVSWGK